MNNRQPTSFGKSGLTVGQLILRVCKEQSSKRRTDSQILEILQQEFGRSYQTEGHRVVAYWIGRYNTGSLPGQTEKPREKAFRYDETGNPFIRRNGPPSKAERGA